ncbi:hypothetical protein GCM10011394_13000 [Luteimonas terricola]|uniref:Transposase n=1 Tax=Luteimonas terricola TaxID=645597 RepID=A0ABQ2EFZ2_9GAMM|nr:hypothetical protein GCM10011394_13000 [Luteimonas terricola]
MTQRAEILGISRGSVYYLPRRVPAEDSALMRGIDELHLELPFAGSRMPHNLLNQKGFAVGRKHAAR